MVRFGYTILYVRDVAKAVDFYKAAFGFTDKFISPENDYAELSTGETALAFISQELGHANLKDGFLASDAAQLPLGIEIALVTDEVEQTLQAALGLGAILVSEPVQKPWGQTVSYIRDLDGFLIELCSPMS